MMGQQSRTESLFYYFRLEEQIPTDHLLRMIDGHVDFSFVREQLKDFYSPTGRPSIDPEVLLRLLLVGYLYGITSERRLMDEVRMHLAYRWFTRLGFDQEVPDHSTFSKNRHGRFRQSGVFRKVFEEIVRRCLEAGFVEGRNVAVDGTLVGANASQQSRVPRERLVEAAKLSRTVQEYLTELERRTPWQIQKGARSFKRRFRRLIQMLPGLSKAGRRCWATTTTIWWTPRAESFCRSMLRRPYSVKKHWPRGVWLSMLVSSEFNHRIWQPIRLMEVESFWRGSWNETFNPTFRSSIAVTRPKGISHESIFATSQKKMPTTARKENHCAIAVRHAVVGECLLFDGSAMPRVSTEEALHHGSQSEIIYSLAGASATNSSRVGRYA